MRIAFAAVDIGHPPARRRAGRVGRAVDVALKRDGDAEACGGTGDRPHLVVHVSLFAGIFEFPIRPRDEPAVVGFGRRVTRADDLPRLGAAGRVGRRGDRAALADGNAKRLRNTGHPEELRAVRVGGQIRCRDRQLTRVPGSTGRWRGSEHPEQHCEYNDPHRSPGPLHHREYKPACQSVVAASGSRQTFLRQGGSTAKDESSLAAIPSSGIRWTRRPGMKRLRSWSPATLPA